MSGSARVTECTLLAALLIGALLFGGLLAGTRTGAGASQSEAWVLQGYAVGKTTGNEPGGGVSMAEVIMLSSGTYRMYYSYVGGTGGAIMKYADSTDLVHWTVKGVSLQGSSTTSAADYDIRGPSVLKLSDGTYRMYVQASAQGSSAFEQWYATSADGATFTMMGATVTSSAYDPNSSWSLAGHGTYYRASNGTYVYICSGKFTTDPVNTPSDLKMATSSDGLTWKNLKTLYSQWHDPIVLRTSTGYKMYATYLLQSQGTAFSSDGMNWPSQMSTATFQDQGGSALTEGANGVGDIGGVVAANGQGMLFTNYGNPSNDIAYFTSSSWPTTTTSSSTSISSTSLTSGTATSTVPTTTAVVTSTFTLTSTMTYTSTVLTTLASTVTSTSTASFSTTSTATVTATVTSSATSTATVTYTETTTTGGGAIPEFPYQLTAVSVFVLLVVSFHLLTRRR